MINQFKRKDPFKSKCSRDNCAPCKSIDTTKTKTSDCRSNNIVYGAQCIECEEEGKTRVYIGETSRNLYMRSCEHYSAFKSKAETSFMLRHIRKEHENNAENVKFKWKVLKKFQRPLQRQLYESQKISSKSRNMILNSKLEFNSVNTKKLFMQKQHFQCKGCSAKFEEKKLEFRSHSSDFHEEIQCKFCNYTSIGKIDLKYHNLHKHHAGEMTKT